MKISDRLTPEERELARLLGQPRSSEQPGAELDARVLAMARQPLSSAPAASPRSARSQGWGRRRSVTSSLAIAASLVLVVGLAWQLRPTPPAAPVPSAVRTAPAIYPASAPPQAEAAAGGAGTTAPASIGAPAATTDKKAPDAKGATTPLPARARTSERPAPRAASASDAAVVTAPAVEATPMVTSPSPPAPPAPAPAMTPQQAMAPQNDEYAGAQADRRTALQAPPVARTAAPRPEPLAAVRSSGSTPQSAEYLAAERLQQWQSALDSDAALPRRQWLKRIRERRDSGDLSGARLSLRRFMQEYPEARIPRDLRPLLTD
jgi:hypothetical protein